MKNNMFLSINQKTNMNDINSLQNSKSKYITINNYIYYRKQNNS